MRAGLAGLAAMRGDPVEARDLVLRAIDDWEDQGNARRTLEPAQVPGDGGQRRRPPGARRPAGRCRGGLAAESGRASAGAFFPFTDPRETAAEVLDERSMERAWAEGSAMTLEEALAYARNEA